MSTQSKDRQRRTRHSYRNAIRDAIRRRLALGEPLHVRKIIDEAGGGSASTVQEEIANLAGKEKLRASTLVGAGTGTVHDRVRALENALDDALEREKVLTAEVQVLRNSLSKRDEDVAKLMLTHVDSQKMLLQGVDDLRQMVRAGRDALPSGVIAAEDAKVSAPAADNQAVYWQTKHEALLRKYVDLDRRNRLLASRLSEAGIDVPD